VKQRFLSVVLVAITVSLALASGACGASTTSSASDGGALADGGAATDGGGAGDAGVDKAANCASTFGNQIPASFGRLDGTVHAVLQPTDQQCALPNGTHIVLQVDWSGATYRMVVNVDVLYAEKTMALPGLAWSEGWHPGTIIDYVGALGVHSTDFTRYDTNELVRRVLDRLVIGAKVSVYAGTDRAMSASAHLVHRSTTAGGPDGAIVVNAGVAGVTPTFLLFRFANQTF